jgi:Family of unknown function (DUF5681)
MPTSSETLPVGQAEMSGEGNERMTETTRALQKPHLWGPGQSGNPAGRPRGSRNKLAEAFVADCHQAWIEHGPEAIQRVLKDDPATFLKIVAGLLPKDVNLKVSQLDELTDEQLLRKLRSLTEMARPLLARVVPEPAGAETRAARPVDDEYVDGSND